MIATAVRESARAEASASARWLRALELTASIPRNRQRLMSNVIEELADRHGDAPALLSDRDCLTYRSLAERIHQYAHWALEQGVKKGDVVGLLMTNQPEYFAVWAGVSSTGGVVALLNTNLIGPSLAHCIRIAAPAHLIVSAELVESLTSALPSLTNSPSLWIHGGEHAGFQGIDNEIRRLPRAKPDSSRHENVTIEDRALYIYTSGTTGLPKAANVSHARVMQWTHWFAGMMDVQPDDRMYNCLPMYHSIGGVLAPGAVLVAGSSAVLREKFSVSNFWSDVERWDCTILQYIGEFCRYLLHHPHSNRVDHRIRLACGNGLVAEIWEAFQQRFRIPRILEFYASTEGGVSLFNAEGKTGSIGRVPGYLAHRFSPALVRVDPEKDEPVRNVDGFCLRSGKHEPGEAIGRLAAEPSQIGSRFEGYTDEGASGRKILRDVFERGDAWVRTGDLMRKDENGFFYFVDRLGDTFRWKGENVATSEVASAICAFPGVRHAVVYGVQVPGNEGRAGMAAIAVENDIDLPAFRQHLVSRLPQYAVPLFVRLCEEIEVTGTFKYSKTELVRQGYDPSASTDAIFFHDAETRSFRQIDESFYRAFHLGEIRV